MITIISGTNRPGSNTRKVAAHVEAIYQKLGVKTHLLDLAEREAAKGVADGDVDLSVGISPDASAMAQFKVGFTPPVLTRILRT